MGLLFQFDRIDLPSISLAPIYKCLLGDSFFDQSYETSSRLIKEVDLNRFDLKGFLREYIRALLLIVISQYPVKNTVQFDRDRPLPTNILVRVA